MARYIKQEMPDLNGTGETKCYYRLEKRRNLSTKEFLKKAGAHGILDEGVLKHALSKIAEQLVEELAEGNTVTLEGIGTFQATLGVKKDKEMDTIDGDGPKRNAKSIEVKNVRYVSDKDLVNDVNLHCKLTRAGVSRVNRSPYTKEERLKMLQDYLADATHPFIRVADYAELTSLPRSTATKELRTFSETPLMVSQRVAGERRLCMLKGWKYKIIRNIDEMMKATMEDFTANFAPLSNQ